MNLIDFASLDPDPDAARLKRDLIDIVMWTENESPRSRQRALGPSELGDPCDRRIAYKLAGTDPVNRRGDPWPAVVGTAIHNWLEVAVTQYQAAHGDRGWIVEERVQPDKLVSGRSDLFHVPSGTVIDHKTASSDKIKKLHRGEPPSPGYITQINLYGLGHERAGREVRNVALIYYPRSGWLNDCFVWHAAYDRAVAASAIDRLYGIGFRLLDLDIRNHPEKFVEIPATGGDNCVWCPMFSREMDPAAVASETGCPGH